jgi:putative flippase GtrA
VIQQFLSKQFILFLVTGGTAALVNFGSRIVYNQWVSFSVAIFLAYLTGMVTAFVLARWLVFKRSEQSFALSAMLFCAVNVIAVVQTWLISMGLALYVLPYWGVTRFAAEIAHAVGVMVPVLTSYLGHKHFSFRERE